MGEAMADMAMVDTVARDLLMLTQKLMPITATPLDTDTAPDTDLDTDMAVMVLALPAMEVMVLDMNMVDTVSTRDLLMPIMEDTDMAVDTDTKFCFLYNKLPLILISSHYTH